MPTSSTTHRVRALDVAAAARRWLALAVATARNAKGQSLARTRVRLHLVPLLGSRPLRSLRGDDIRRYRLALERRGLAPLTVTHVLADLRALLRWAEGERLIARSPFPRRVLPRVPERAPRGFTSEETRRLCALTGRRGFVLRLLLATGLRWSEACALRAEHVVDARLEVRRSKSGRIRRIPLSPALVRELHAAGERPVHYASGSPGSFARGVRRASGIAEFHVHRCRHTFAMRWLAAGGSLAVLQELLGHRDITTTMRYARVSDDLVQREAERVAARLEGPE